MKIAIIIFMIIFIMYCIFVCYVWWLDDLSIINIKAIKTDDKSFLKSTNIDNLIKVVRTDNSIRYVTIMLDEKTNEYCFVNLTKDHNHVCPCRFETKSEAIQDLENDPKVMHWEYIK